jgi:VWFA-related protein
MRTYLKLALGLSLAIPSLSATAQQTPQAPPKDADVIHVSSKLIVVDVIVQDKSGKPIHGLKPEDFRLSENKSPQPLRHFEEHSTADAPPPAGPKLPPLPPGIFTDYTPTPPSGTLNILLLDALNTPTKDQSYVRDQLQQYVKNAPAGTRIAIFGLANRLILLQGFSSDPQTLKDAVDHKLIPRGSNLLDDPSGNGVDQLQGSDLSQTAGTTPTDAEGAIVQEAANLQQFEAETQALETQLRVQYTLDAFNTLGHYLSTFPGRKNLIWFSASFPINILPDPSLQNSFVTVNLNQAEYKETVNLLSKAQVALYPIDARGLVTPPAYNAASGGRQFARNPGAFAAQNQKFNTAQATEHSTMENVAEDTGGKAAYNTNGIAQAVANAVNSGSNYYTLSYSPSDKREDGAYRTIKVDLVGAQAGQNLQLSYRRGYYADDADHRKTETAAANAAPANGASANAAYQRAAMSRGAPTPQDLLFKVRVLPTTSRTETTLAPSNNLDKSIPATGPFRRYAVDYVALPNEFTLTPQPDGKHTGKMQFMVYVFNTDGLLLNATGQTIDLDLSPESYQRFEKGVIKDHIEISVPVTRDDMFLRVGIEDVASNKFGVVEMPVGPLSRLTPLDAQTPPSTPAAAPSKSPASPPTPSTPPASSTKP